MEEECMDCELRTQKCPIEFSIVIQLPKPVIKIVFGFSTGTRNVTYCDVFHRQTAKIGSESGLMPFILCKRNHRPGVFPQRPAMSSPKEFSTQNWDASSSGAFRRIHVWWGWVRQTSDSPPSPWDTFLQLHLTQQSLLRCLLKLN